MIVDISTNDWSTIVIMIVLFTTVIVVDLMCELIFVVHRWAGIYILCKC